MGFFNRKSKPAKRGPALAVATIQNRVDLFEQALGGRPAAYHQITPGQLGRWMSEQAELGCLACIIDTIVIDENESALRDWLDANPVGARPIRPMIVTSNRPEDDPYVMSLGARTMQAVFTQGKDENLICSSICAMVDDPTACLLPGGQAPAQNGYAAVQPQPAQGFAPVQAPAQPEPVYAASQQQPQVGYAQGSGFAPVQAEPQGFQPQVQPAAAVQPAEAAEEQPKQKFRNVNAEILAMKGAAIPVGGDSPSSNSGFAPQRRQRGSETPTASFAAVPSEPSAPAEAEPGSAAPQASDQQAGPAYPEVLPLQGEPAQHEDPEQGAEEAAPEEPMQSAYPTIPGFCQPTSVPEPEPAPEPEVSETAVEPKPEPAAEPEVEVEPAQEPEQEAEAAAGTGDDNDSGAAEAEEPAEDAEDTEKAGSESTAPKKERKNMDAIAPDQLSKRQRNMIIMNSPVRCVETGEVFANPAEAKRRYGKDILTAIRTGVKAAGLHWETAETEHAKPAGPATEAPAEQQADAAAALSAEWRPTKPADTARQAINIKRSLGLTESPESAKATINVAGLHKGCGCTTLASALALELQALGRRPLLVLATQEEVDDLGWAIEGSETIYDGITYNGVLVATEDSETAQRAHYDTVIRDLGTVTDKGGKLTCEADADANVLLFGTSPWNVRPCADAFAANDAAVLSKWVLGSASQCRAVIAEIQEAYAETAGNGERPAIWRFPNCDYLFTTTEHHPDAFAEIIGPWMQG